jgi:hypothetical protein
MQAAIDDLELAASPTMLRRARKLNRIKRWLPRSWRKRAMRWLPRLRAELDYDRIVRCDRRWVKGKSRYQMC